MGKINRSILIFSMASSIFLISLQIFRWNLMDIFTPFFEPIIEITAILFILVTMIVAAVYFFINYKLKGVITALPLLIQLISLLILIFVPFTAIILKIDYNCNLEERQKVVSMIENGELALGKNGLIQLPPDLKHLSKGGGEIMVDRKDGTLKVLFFTFRGILDSCAGWAYRSEGEPNRNDFNQDIHEWKKMKENWFYISSR